MLESIKLKGKFETILANQRANFVSEYVRFLRTETERSKDTYYFDLKNEIPLEYNGVEMIDSFAFTSFLMKIAGSLKNLEKTIMPKKVSAFDNPDVEVIIRNFHVIQNNFGVVNSKLLKETEEKKGELALINLLCITFAVGVLLLSSIFTYPSYQKYNKYLERVMHLVARVSEADAEADIANLRACKQLLHRSDEKYMVLEYATIPRGNNNLRTMLDLPTTSNIQGKSSRSEKSPLKPLSPKKIQPNLLWDRVKNPYLPRFQFLTVSLILITISLVFLFVVFFYVEGFESYIDKPMKTYVSYLERSSDLTNLFMLQNFILFRPIMRSSITNPRSHYYFDDSFLDRLNESREKFLRETYDFYTDEFLVTVINKNYAWISRMNTEEACDILQGGFITHEICANLSQGVMKRGFHAVLMTVFQFLKNEEIFMFIKIIPLSRVLSI